jgi:hypothetical protein
VTDVVNTPKDAVVDVWSLLDGPFVFEAKHTKEPGTPPAWSLDVFEAFAKAPGARGYEISRLSHYVMVLRLTDGHGSSVIYEAHKSSMTREEKRRLADIMRDYPAGMANIFRDKMGRVCDLFLS